MPGIFRGLHRAYKKHEGKLLGVFTIAIYGATLGVVVETVLNADYPAVRQRKPGATTVSPGPTIQGFDLPPVETVERAKRTSAEEKKVEEEKGGGPGEEA